MSEFKFSCPHCQQGIQATTEYVGVQINCPSCQTPLVVPEPVEMTPGGKRKAKLNKSASTVEHIVTTPAMATNMARRRRKVKWGLYIGLAAGGAVAIAAIIFYPKAIQKYNDHKAQVAAEQAAAELAAHPPPPPPELKADEILKKVDETYTSLTSLSIKGDSVANFDLSQMAHAPKGTQTVNTKIALLLGRPNHYRFEWEHPFGKKVINGAIWAAGDGNYVRTASTPTKVKTREAAFSSAAASSMTMGTGMAELFFSSPDNVSDNLKDFSKQNDEAIDNHKCYVIVGEASLQHVTLWIRRNEFVISQIKITLGGQIDKGALAKLSPGERLQAQAMARLKGDITETYSDIQTNQELAAADFEKPIQTATTAGAAPEAPKHKKSGARAERKKEQ